MRIPVKVTDHPRTDRWVNMTELHMFATTVYAVAVVDGRNCLVSDLRTFASPAPSQTYADKLVQRNGSDASAELQRKHDMSLIQTHSQMRRDREEVA